MRRALLAAMLLAIALCGVATAPISSRAQAPQPAAPFQPGIADLMTMVVQPRHIRLWLSGRQQNWIYAEYELKELDDSLRRVARSWPKYKGLPLGGMVDAIAKGPMAAVTQAIADQNATKFATAFDQLTEGCNACHQAANVGWVVIKVPVRGSFPDQDFRPVKP
jgi:hypothetical protein